MPVIPATTFSPGTYLADELDARQWTTAMLAERSGLAMLTIQRILDHEKAIDTAIADALALALGTSATLWVNLERAYFGYRMMGRTTTAPDKRPTDTL